MAAMVSVQCGIALSVGLIGQVSVAGTAWLRLTMGALIFLVLSRPSLRGVSRRDVAVLVGLGTATGFMAVMFLAAVDRIPMGTASAIELLGPLTVAAVRSRSARAAVWPVVAFVGVVILTQPWRGDIDLLGVGAAALAALCWAIYMVLTQRVGDRFHGVQGLALTIPVAAVVAAFFGAPEAVGNLDARVLLASLGLAVLIPCLPFSLEMLALRRMTASSFGTLMSLEPAIALVLGLVILHQVPSASQLAGLAVVVVAAAAAQRGGSRAGKSDPSLDWVN